MIAYLTTTWDDRIKEVEVEKWSAQSVWIKNTRGKSSISRIETDGHHYFKTRNEAVAYKLNQHQTAVRKAEDILERAKRKLAAFTEAELPPGFDK